MCKKFQKSWPHRLWDYNVWSRKKSFFACARQGQQTLTACGAKSLNYATLSFYTIVMRIMLGTCVPNHRGRWWVEHTQIHPALKKGTKNFHNTSKSWGIFFMKQKFQWWIWRSRCTLNFFKIKFENKWNLHSPWGLEHLTLPSVEASFKRLLKIK
jgi:hypothetical protein